MGYYLELLDPKTNETVKFSSRIPLIGSIYQVGGATEATLSITYNYAEIFYRVLDGGIRSIYGKTARETIPILKEAANKLGDDVDPDYWKATDGNAKAALLQLIMMASISPDAIWYGD
jgi:hypothetical protein